jgi:hypothetical protein
VLEKKMNLIIQITPSVVRGDVAGITKSKAMFELERSIVVPAEEIDDEPDKEGDNNEK